MDSEKQIEEMAKVLCGGCPDNKECMHCLCADWYRAEALYNAGYRKQSEVRAEAVREFAKRLKDAFPEANRDYKCPSLYWDDFCDIIDNCAEEMVGEEE